MVSAVEVVNNTYPSNPNSGIDYRDPFDFDFADENIEYKDIFFGDLGYDITFEVPGSHMAGLKVVE